MKSFFYLALSVLVAAMVVGCATTDQKQPTTQQQPQGQSQKDEQWADLRVVATVNNYIGGAAEKPATVDGESATEADPAKLGSPAAVVTIDHINLSVTVTTHGQSEKGGTQSGPSAASNTTATATPTNEVTPNTTVDLTP